MFPGIYDFRWDAGHIIFLGIFYSVLVVVIATMAIAALRALRSIKSPEAEALRWHIDFEDLQPEARRCRHELAGEVDTRECPNGFDCRHCTEHPRFVAARSLVPAEENGNDLFVGGFRLPQNLMYHRGHTSVRRESDGTLTVGLDDLAARLIGTPDKLELPEVGTRVVVNGGAWGAKKNGVPIRLLSPVDGEVVAVGNGSRGWYLKVRPEGRTADLRHLLSAREAKSWMLREVERLHYALASEGVGAALADGGMPVDDLSKVVPPEQLDNVYGAIFLEP